MNCAPPPRESRAGAQSSRGSYPGPFLSIHGAADIHYGGLVRILADDKEKSWIGAEKDDNFKSGFVANIKNFVESINAAKPVNNAATAVESDLTGILGRTAAYKETTVTWDEMLQSNERRDLNLKLK